MFCLGILAIIAIVAAVYLLLRQRAIHLWIVSYLRTNARNSAARQQAQDSGETQHVMFCFVDHFEPQWQRPELSVEHARVDRWVEKYPELTSNHRDADGCYPKHTFFYPAEEYRVEHLDKLTALCRAGYGEIEVHIHHDGDTQETLTEKLVDFSELLHTKHRALPVSAETGKPVWAFIHGNWALCNSAPGGKHCGVDREIEVLTNTGCYVDMTMPAAPSPCQSRTVNQIMYSVDPEKSPSIRGHDKGVEAVVGKAPAPGLLLIPGPLGFDMTRRKLGIIPKIENGDVRDNMEPTPARVDSWVNTHIHVPGKENWIFVKVHTHGTQEASEEALLGPSAEAMYTHLEKQYNDGSKYKLHYVSAREMYNIAKAAEAGENGDPNEFRDYQLNKAEFQQS